MEIFGIPGTAGTAPQPTVFAFLFFFGSILIGSSGSIWVKRHAKRTVDIHNSANSFNLLLVLFETLFFLVASFIVAAIHGTPSFTLHGGTLLCAAIRAVAYVLGMLGYLMAVRHGPLLLTVVILRMGLAIPILLSAIIWPEGNKISWYMYIGMVLMIVALILFNKKDGESGQPLSKTTPVFWFWVLVGAVGNGMEGFAIKLLETEYQGQGSLENCLFYASILQVIVFGVIMLVRPPQRTGVGADGVALPATEKPHYDLRSLLAITFVGGVWILGYAITNATSFYTGGLMVTYLPTVFYFMANTGFSILIAFAIARFIFREKLRPMQYIGVVVAVVGLILLNDWSSVFA